MNREIIRVSSMADLAVAAADRLVMLTRSPSSGSEDCYLALSGGQTPRGLYEHLRLPRYRTRVPWDGMHFFWGDERWVARNDPASNFHGANVGLLSHVPVHPGNVHPVPVHLSSPAAAAASYEDSIREIVPGSVEGFPTFDLILLGVGSDGHTASLFPGASTLKEKVRLVVPAEAPAGVEPASRITFTLPLINHARNVLVLVAERGKKAVLNRILNAPPRSEPDQELPAALIEPRENLCWIIVEG